MSRVSVAPIILGYVDTTTNHEQGKAFKKDRRQLRALDADGAAITVAADSSNQLNNNELICSANMKAFLGRKIIIGAGSDAPEVTVIGVDVMVNGTRSPNNIRMSVPLSVGTSEENPTALYVLSLIHI